jgi:hypothetical protein
VDLSRWDFGGGNFYIMSWFSHLDLAGRAVAIHSFASQ